MPLINLVYVSFATQPFSEDELRDLLKLARENNGSLDVTGMLLYRNGFFIQALEGEDDVVSELYEKIKQDNRHQNILEIYRDTIKKRQFGDWSMGFNTFDADSLKEVEGYSDFLEADTSNFFVKNPGYAKSLLYMFSNKSIF